MPNNSYMAFTKSDANFFLDPNKFYKYENLYITIYRFDAPFLVGILKEIQVKIANPKSDPFFEILNLRNGATYYLCNIDITYSGFKIA